jgi:cell division septation protein DedD
VRLLVLPIALLLGLACAALVACGGGSGADLIPAGKASRIEAQLDRIRAAVDAGSCTRLPDDVATLQQQVNALPSSVDPELRSRLQEGVDNLAQISVEECLARANEQTTPTQTTPTTTTPTTTTPPETTPTTPPPETTPPPVTTEPPPTTTPTTPAPTDGTGGGATIPTEPGAAGGATPTP